MKFFKALPIVALSIALAACSGGPSDSDVQAIADQAIGQMEQVMAATGEPMPGTPASDQMYMQKGDNGWIASR